MKIKLRTIILTALVLLPLSAIFSQTRPVSGRVSESKGGASVSNVSVVIKGSTAGTLSDGEGRYSLSVPEGAVLQFVLMGYRTVEVPVGSRHS